MDYFNNVLTVFLDLDCVRILAVYGRVKELSEFIKHILICVPKINGGLRVWNDMRFKVQGSLLFVTYTIIQGIISSEM